MRGRSAVNLRWRDRNIAQASKQGSRTAEEQAEALARALDRLQLAGVVVAAKITTAKEQQLAMGILEGVKDTLQARKARGGQRQQQQQQEISALDAGALGGLAGKRLGRQATRVLGIKRGAVAAARGAPPIGGRLWQAVGGRLARLPWPLPGVGQRHAWLCLPRGRRQAGCGQEEPGVLAARAPGGMRRHTQPAEQRAARAGQ